MKPLPIGVDDFEKLFTKGYYYVDKTLFIKELLNRRGTVNLFTHPRHFGKTLNLNMLCYYFEIQELKKRTWRTGSFSQVLLLKNGRRIRRRNVSVSGNYGNLEICKTKNISRSYGLFAGFYEEMVNFIAI